MDYGNITLFETSWEVCNKVGGIYTVVSSKVLQAVENFGENYWLLGPDFGNNADFEEDTGPSFDPVRTTLKQHNLKCRIGHWLVPGNPKVILVDFSNFCNQNQLLYDYWKLYNVDSMSGGWDYVEPVMFATACGEVIKTIYQHFVEPVGMPAVAHFHEWMCGAGILHLKRFCPTIGTVFTTHATMLGRSMCGNGRSLFNADMESSFNPRQEADRLNITAKHSMESTSAREADCFTAVSELTGSEAATLLGKAPDVVTPNGLDLRLIPDFSETRLKPGLMRKVILEKASTLLRRQLPEDTCIVMTSGRYEFVNKGIDVFLEALAGINAEKDKELPHILAICAVMGGHNGVNEAAVSCDLHAKPADGDYWITSHNLHNAANDPILCSCKRLGLSNAPDCGVSVIFDPALLNGSDGFFDLNYEDLLTGCDMGVFPSWYEPWGYTPEESAAYSVPAVTTDLAGFGLWVRTHCRSGRKKTGVTILSRRQQSSEEVASALQKEITAFARLSEEEKSKLRTAARETAGKCDWSHLFSHYLKAYNMAISKAMEAGLEIKEGTSDLNTSFFAAVSFKQPNLHTFTSHASLPKSISRLRELAMNLWWCWNPKSWDLFSALAPDVWESGTHNPIKCLENASAEGLQRASADPAYLALYEETMNLFDKYMARTKDDYGQVTKEHPVAYFSTEYGLHESFPIYSGGLGILSGDHLKSASDINIPLVAVGLFYRYGYFNQTIDKDGRQVANYELNEPINLPMEEVRTPSGDALEINVQLGDRRLFAKVWRVRVGTIELYLLDSDVPRNSADDRKVTDHLYVGDRDFRIRQEILLGVGGISLLKKLGIQPSVYHMNEGHSAFLILRLIRDAMSDAKLDYDAARELVRNQCIFTTHTPVDAGNERFSCELMSRYFAHYATSFDMSMDDFLAMGQGDRGRGSAFEMTILALRNSYLANGVSRLHGDVSRHMWNNLWSGAPVSEVPIGHVTNGVHMHSYVSQEMRELLNRIMGENWTDLDASDPGWNKLDALPDKLLWRTRQQQKATLLEYIAKSAPDLFRKLGVDRQSIREALDNLNEDVLLIGFARRFAPYKRANLLFADLDHLERILKDAKHPVILLFAGKAHPADSQGIDIQQQIIRYATDKRFLGHIFFLENYSLAISRLMVQGCDVWLNTPRRPYEASGTSGQKVSVNGVLNLSISDGWWCEGYNGENGWTIGPVQTTVTPGDTQNDYTDAESLYTLLEDQVVPQYYYHDQDGLPSRWLKTIKQSIRTLVPMYSSHRMLKDYMRDYYMPAAERWTNTWMDNFGVIKNLVEWKKSIAQRFDSVKTGLLRIDGMDDDICEVGQTLHVTLSFDAGQLTQEELLVQLVIGPFDGTGFIGKPATVELHYERTTSDGSLVYGCTYINQYNGRQAYGVRIMPTHCGLINAFDTNLVVWI